MELLGQTRCSDDGARDARHVRFRQAPVAPAVLILTGVDEPGGHPIATLAAARFRAAAGFGGIIQGTASAVAVAGVAIASSRHGATKSCGPRRTPTVLICRRVVPSTALMSPGTRPSTSVSTH